MIEHHPKGWDYPVPNMHTLILGTFLPHRDRWSYKFHYPNKHNRFWKIMAQLAGRELTAYEGPAAVAERKKLLRHLRVGVQNMGKTIVRKGNSSLDQNIVITEYQDVLGTIQRHPSLRAILLTGYSAHSSTYRSFIRYLDLHKVPHTLPRRVAGGETFYVEYNGRRIECVISNSTSGAASAIKFETIVDQFRRAISPNQNKKWATKDV